MERMKLALCILIAALWLTGAALAQEKKEQGESELYKRQLELLNELGKKKQAEDEPRKSADKKDAPAPPPAPVPAPAPAKQDLPGFSEVVPVPPVPKTREPAKTELPKPPPQVIRVEPAPRPVVTSVPPASRESQASSPKSSTGEIRRGGPQASTYTIAPGDTFSSIALKLYGDSARWIAIAKANPLVDPVRLKVGQIIKLPDLTALDQARSQEFEQIRRQVSAPATGGGEVQSVMVEPGDNLSTIAQRVYGRASQWRAIYDANKDQLDSPDELKVGMKLKIPPPHGAPSGNNDGTRG